MKILHFITSLKTGGAEAALTNFLTYTHQKLPARTQHTVIYLYNGPHAEKIEKLGIPVFQLKGLVHHYDPIAFLRLIRLIKKINPDVIHTSLWSANIMGRLAGKIVGIPVISDLHGSAVDEGNFRNQLDALTAPLAHKIIAVSASVQSAYQYAVIPKIIGKQHRELVAQNLCVINNGIDINRVRDIARQSDNTSPVSRSNFGWGENDFVIGAVGRLEPIKSYDVLVRAFALLLNLSKHEIPPGKLLSSSRDCHSREGGNLPPNNIMHWIPDSPFGLSRMTVPPRNQSKVALRKFQNNSDSILPKSPKLCLVGDGSEMHKLKDLAHALGVETNINFIGSRSDAIKFYPLFDCFALSSKSEGLSIALLEALCFGLPIISTHSGMQHDVIAHQINGFLVPVGDEQALAQSLLTLINNKKLVNSMHAANLELIKSFDLAQTVSAYHKLYRQAC